MDISAHRLTESQSVALRQPAHRMHFMLPPATMIDNAIQRLYKDSMKTLTITEARKNLSRWLDAAARGQDIGIILGAEIIALRRVEVESTDYAQREYAAAPEQVAAFADSTEKRYRRLKRSGKLATISAEQLRKQLE